MKKLELLAPAGDFSKLKTALYFGADAVYVGGKAFSLRALAGNFDNDELKQATEYTHKLGKKIYVTANILARNYDFEALKGYFEFLNDIKVDGIIISDVGVLNYAKKYAPDVPLHVSTQMNVLNAETVRFWRDFGVKRVILARELSLEEVSYIHTSVPDVELEAFVHGAMCISYSGRCLLSNYFTGRDSNRGACVQACRWEYEIREKNKKGEFYPIEEDDKGTYILNSKDLNLLYYLDELEKAGVVSLKIEGRMKSEYYIATVVNAYRRALDAYYVKGEEYKTDESFMTEVCKTVHRDFTTAYALGNNEETVNYDDSQSKGTHTFVANVTDYKDGYAVIEQRNRFKVGDTLEVLSPTDNYNKQIEVKRLDDEKGNEVSDAKLVQQKLRLYTDVKLQSGDILRKKL